jgi:hypothetical protein
MPKASISAGSLPSRTIANTITKEMEEEAELIRSSFSDDVLKAIRAVILNLDVTEADRAIVRSTFSNKTLYRIIAKRLSPELDRNAPIGMLQDAWLDAEDMVFGQSLENIAQALEYKALRVDLMKRALAILLDPSVAGLDLSYDAYVGEDPELIKDAAVALLARNTFIRHIDKQLFNLQLIRNMPAKDGAASSAQDSSR